KFGSEFDQVVSPRDCYLENDRRSITAEQLHAFILQQSLTDHLVKLGPELKVMIKRFDQTRPRDDRMYASLPTPRVVLQPIDAICINNLCEATLHGPPSWMC